MERYFGEVIKGLRILYTRYPGQLLGLGVQVLA